MRKGHPNCPNCGRPMGYEYLDSEPGRCQLWRNLAEGFINIDGRTIVDCFKHTTTRVRELTARIAELEASKAAAQRALARQYDATLERVKRFELCLHDTLKRSCEKCKDKPGAWSAAFPDNARIE